MKSIKRPLALRKETIRSLNSSDIQHLVGGNMAGPAWPSQPEFCGTLISCAACTALTCILNTSVITSCH